MHSPESHRGTEPRYPAWKAGASPQCLQGSSEPHRISMHELAFAHLVRKGPWRRVVSNHSTPVFSQMLIHLSYSAVQ